MKGPKSLILKNVIENYNNSEHRGIGMTPNEAQKDFNYFKIIMKQNEYAKEFVVRKSPREFFKLNDQVLIKNENKKSKMDNEFSVSGFIKKVLSKNTYVIETEDQQIFVRHESQLKRFKEGDVGFYESSYKGGNDVNRIDQCQ
ncbi:hypothetical protein DMUE_0296 [Dictyocoela muelleri]|nr:hypothetical protein DMUE_0296 [Dictyocoela muelleri]